MVNTTVDSWKHFFYSPEELLHENHGKLIISTNTKTDEDTRYFKKLIEQAFDLHLVSRPKKVNLESLELGEEEAEEFFKKIDISNLFINDYYEYPTIERRHRGDVKTVEETIKPKGVLEEIRKQIANPNGMVVLIGDIGEGKSTFLSKLALELTLDTSGQKYCPIIINVQELYDEKYTDWSEPLKLDTMG